MTCNWTADGYRLPTLAEWEYAARGGKTGVEAAAPTVYAGTSDDSQLGTYIWYKPNSENKTHAVKRKAKNGLDLFDMCGNVAEWCWDWSGTAISATTPWTGAATGENRVTRGGSWNCEYGLHCRIVQSTSCSPCWSGANDIGFRVVRSAP